jgi:uncharacterized membrane protein
MEILVSLLAIALIIFIFSKMSSFSDKVTGISHQLRDVIKVLQQISAELSEIKNAAKSNENLSRTYQSSVVQIREEIVKANTEVEVAELTPSEPEVVVPVESPAVVTESPFIDKDPIQVPEQEPAIEFSLQAVEEIQHPVTEEQVSPLPAFQDYEVSTEEAAYARVSSLPKEQAPKAPPKPSFFERNPDLEKFVGENLINKIGIAILVLGIGFFVKYAIDQNWINEIGRVAIGILCGGLLLGIAHKLRHDFKPFSSVLVGGGLAVFYFTIAIAFKEYQIFSKEVAFGLMVLITGFAVLLSIAYNRIEIAVLAIIGGFISPFFVSDGSGSYVVLMTYILILNIGMLILAYFKRWNLVNIICFVFTILLFTGWLSTKVLNQENGPYMGALIFATCFYVIFFFMNIVNNVKENRKFVAFDISILVSNNVFYFSTGMLVLQHIDNGAYQGLFTALMGVFNLIFAYTLYKSKKADKNLVYLLIGLVLTFASLAAPIQLEGNYITMFWALEAVLLLWLSQKSGIQLIKVGSTAVTVLTVISLLMDWRIAYYINSELPLSSFLTKAFVTSCISLVSLGLLLFLSKREGLEILSGISKYFYQTVIAVTFIVLSYFAFLLEVHYQVQQRISVQAIRNLYLGSYHLAYASVLLFMLNKTGKAQAVVFSFFVTGILSFLYIILFNRSAAQVRDLVLTGETSPLHYFYHYVLFSLMILLIVMLSRLQLKKYPTSSEHSAVYFWILSAFLIYLFSAELEHLVVYAVYSEGGEERIQEIRHNVFRIGFPILWGVGSFILMYLGMKRKARSLRIISLTIFGLTLLKLFIFDVRQMNEGGKIAAFISLGVLLLIVSFMYQKLKKLVADDKGN